MTRCKLLVPAAICAVLVGGAGVMSAYTGEELAKDAKITLSEARAIALKAFPGKITDKELEKEKGGSGLRYSFDIKNGRTAVARAPSSRCCAPLELMKKALGRSIPTWIGTSKKRSR